MYDWLLDYQKLIENIDYMEYRLQREKNELRRYTDGDLMNVKLVEDSIASGLEERIELYEHELAHKMNDKFNLEMLIATFEGLDNKIMYLKYIECKNLIEISEELNYSYSYIKTKHAQIMKLLKYHERFNNIQRINKV